MAWEDIILPRLAKAISIFADPSPKTVLSSLIDLKSLPPFYFGIDRKSTKALSPNHYEMGCSYDLLRSVLLNDPIAWQSACGTYIHLLNLHLRSIGLWTTEQFTGAPHGGFYLSSLVAARMALIVAHNRDLSISPQLAIDLDEYTYRTIQYLTASATSTGEVICCGERMPKGPSAPQQSAFYRELISIPHPKDEARKIERQIDKPDDYFWLSLRGLRALIEGRDHIRAIADLVKQSPLELPFTAQQVIIERFNNGHLASYYSQDRGDGTCEWVYIRDGEISWGPRGTTKPVIAKSFRKVIVLTQSRGDKLMPSLPPPTSPSIPITFDQLDTISRLPFDQANSIISRADPTLVESWGRKLYGAKFGEGYMHSTDHRAALVILLNREPTYREVYDSYHAGSANIDAARIKSGSGLRPSDWPHWNEEQRRYSVLVHRYGINTGSRIMAGRAKDPDPKATQDQYTAWNSIDKPTEKPPTDPVDPVKPPIDPIDPKPPIDPVKPPVPSIDQISGTMTLTIAGVPRRFKITEDK